MFLNEVSHKIDQEYIVTVTENYSTITMQTIFKIFVYLISKRHNAKLYFNN